MNATTAFNVFVRAVVLERRIPFEIQASDGLTRADGRQPGSIEIIGAVTLRNAIRAFR